MMTHSHFHFLIWKMSNVKVILRALCDQGCLDIYKFSKYCPRTEYDPNKQKICHLEKVLGVTQSIENSRSNTNAKF